MSIQGTFEHMNCWASQSQDELPVMSEAFNNYEGTFDDAGGTTLTDAAASFPTAGVGLVGWTVRITSGTGEGEYRVVTANTATTVTVASLTTSATSGYHVYPDLNIQTTVKKYTAAAKLDFSPGNGQCIRWHLPFTTSTMYSGAHGRWIRIATAPTNNDGITLFGLGTTGDAMLGINNSRQLTLVTTGGTVRATGSVALTLDTWYWAAIQASVHTVNAHKLYARVYDTSGTLVDAFDTAGATFSVSGISAFAIGVAFVGAGAGLVAYIDGGIGVSGVGQWPPICPDFWSAVPSGVGAENQWVSSTVSDSGTSTGVTTGPPGTLTDTGKAWTVNVWAGFMVWSNNKTMIIASNTATVLTGTTAWSGGSNPGTGAYNISPGSKWLEVDDIPHDSDATYLYRMLPSGTKQRFTFPASGLGSVNIHAVGVGVHSKAASGLIGGGMFLVSEATTLVTPSTSYNFYPEVQRSTTPAGAEWTVANLDDVQLQVSTFSSTTITRYVTNVVKFACYGGTFLTHERRRGSVI